MVGREEPRAGVAQGSALRADRAGEEVARALVREPGCWRRSSEPCRLTASRRAGILREEMIAVATTACRMLTALLLAGAAAAQADVTRTGKTFAVTVHPGKLPEAAAVQLADAALAAAERVRPALDKYSLCPAKTPVIHVHADERPFRALAVDTTKLAFHVEGFVQLAEGCAHVLLWPSLDARDYGLVGLPPGTEHQVMLQAVQFAVFQRYAWVKVDPWRAGVIAHGIVDEILNPDAATGVDPMFDDRRSWYAEQFAKGKAPKLRDELEWTDVPESRGAF